jgi:DNA-binding GntR family transcriptional regulator
MTSLQLAPVSFRTTIQDSVYQQLRQALMTGHFNPGQILTIASLAETFGTSHMPVREAIRRLAAENALEVAANGSAHVPYVDQRRLDDLCLARTALEGTAIELCASKVTKETLSYLESCIHEHAHVGRNGDIYSMLGKNQDFHFALYRASGSEVIVQLVETLWLRFGPYMRMLTQYLEPLLRTGQLDLDPLHHYVMLEALKHGDASAARNALVHDIRSTQQLLHTYCLSAETVDESTLTEDSSSKVAVRS